jgi:Flp pilus assembly protein TadG
LVEFAIALPTLLLILLGLAQFGTIYYNYILVTNATAAGARQFSISRLDASPYSDTVAAINAASANLGNLTITLTVNTTVGATVTASVCATNSACQTDLQNAYLNGQSAKVAVSYQCAANSILPTYLLNISGLCPVARAMYSAVE